MARGVLAYTSPRPRAPLQALSRPFLRGLAWAFLPDPSPGPRHLSQPTNPLRARSRPFSRTLHTSPSLLPTLFSRACSRPVLLLDPPCLSLPSPSPLPDLCAESSLYLSSDPPPLPANPLRELSEPELFSEAESRAEVTTNATTTHREPCSHGQCNYDE